MACPVPGRSERPVFGQQSVSETGLTGAATGLTMDHRLCHQPRPNRRIQSFVPQRSHLIHFSRSPRRNVGGETRARD